MASNEREEAMSRAITYGTIWTNSLFDKDSKTFKIARSGHTLVRLSVSGLIWGGILFFLALGIFAGIMFKIFHLPGAATPLLLVFAGLVGFIGYNLGQWSPLQSTTGEDLNTWIMMKMRKKVALGGFGVPKPAEVELVSYAVGDSKEGKIVRCQRFIGTQPLTNAPPMSAFHEDFVTPYEIVRHGEYKPVDVSTYNDGLRDRSFA